MKECCRVTFKKEWMKALGVPVILRCEEAPSPFFSFRSYGRWAISVSPDLSFIRLHFIKILYTWYRIVARVSNVF